MRYIIDHDLHIHSGISLCSGDPEQTPARILQYAVENGLKHICLTDHYWDSHLPVANGFDFYTLQDLARIKQALPLPQTEGVTFHFGCETDMDKFFTVGVGKEEIGEFEFIIVPTTHLHMPGFTIDEPDFPLERRAALFVQRFDALLDADLPFGKVGLAHLTCSLMAPAAPQDHLMVLDMIPDEEYARLFARAAEKGMGIELNFPSFGYTEQELPRILRPYRIAKTCGCKFYFGSDAHTPAGLDAAMKNFEHIIDLLQLEESDKFLPFA